MIRLGIGAGLVVAALAGVWFWGQSRYKDGVQDTVTRYIEADKETANDIRETSENILRDLGGINDPDELLRRTGGLRD